MNFSTLKLNPIGIIPYTLHIKFTLDEFLPGQDFSLVLISPH